MSPALALDAPNPHGETVRQVCRACLDTSATYKGLLPRGWRLVPSVGLICRKCWLAGRAR